MTDSANLLTTVKEASERWKTAFNSGNASECAAQYDQNAIMKAEPFGTFEGADQILLFWQNLINDGFTDVKYIEPKFEVIDDKSVVLSSGWTMNKAQGEIYRELWVLQKDGTAKLQEDHFEAKG